ncbi:hypothetical protein DFH09DRAFT_1097826 [Mycena vulgaris]|nr:hypothetical protein DFH09DRAFT_1097826 [Mycena vulgaris]
MCTPQLCKIWQARKSVMIFWTCAMSSSPKCYWLGQGSGGKWKWQDHIFNEVVACQNLKKFEDLLIDSRYLELLSDVIEARVHEVRNCKCAEVREKMQAMLGDGDGAGAIGFMLEMAFQCFKLLNTLQIEYYVASNKANSMLVKLERRVCKEHNPYCNSNTFVFHSLEQDAVHSEDFDIRGMGLSLALLRLQWLARRGVLEPLTVLFKSA